MSASQQVINHPAMNGALLEKVILGNDLSGLTSLEKVQYVKQVCQTLGLNPVTKPIQLMKFQGKEIPYFTKDATEQLRKINKVSINNIDTKMLDGGVYVVTATASTFDGRGDSSTGVISISGLKGDALSNAMMKAETKAKRRVTLSICGLGFIDECEVESIPHAQKMDITQVKNEPLKVMEMTEDDKYAALNAEKVEKDFLECLGSISNSQTENDLKNAFEKVKDFRAYNELFKQLIDAKDKRKGEITVKEFNVKLNEETGEVLS